MEITLQRGDKATIPTGCKATVSEGYVLVEAVTPEFKRGDFIVANDDIHIVSIVEGEKVFFDVWLDTAAGLVYFENDWGHGCNFRHATTEERTKLLEDMHAEGKDWDFEKQEVVDWEWRPKMGDVYFAIDSTGRNGLIEYEYEDDKTDAQYVNLGFCFRTRELAEAALQVLKQCKHY